jgi:hypothetical protein
VSYDYATVVSNTDSDDLNFIQVVTGDRKKTKRFLRTSISVQSAVSLQVNFALDGEKRYR